MPKSTICAKKTGNNSEKINIKHGVNQMKFGGIFGKKKEEREIDVETYIKDLGVDESGVIEHEGITYVKPIELSGENKDVDIVTRELKKRNILIVNAAPLFSDKVKLREMIDKLRNTCGDIGGDLCRISAEKILIVPSGMEILQRAPEKRL